MPTRSVMIRDRVANLLANPVVEDKLVTKKQAAARLAVSTRTIDRMAVLGQLEKVFVGPSSRFRKSDLVVGDITIVT